MKRKITALLAMLLSLALLCGCAGLGDDERGGSASTDMVSFNDMEYSRPIIAKLQSKVRLVENALSDGESLWKVINKLNDCYSEYYTFNTMYTIADIRYCQDLTDEYYAQEYAWLGEQYSTVQQIMENLLYSCAASELAERLEDKFFWEGFAEDYADQSQSYYNDAAVSLMQQESALLVEYRSLVTSPTIRIDEHDVDFNSYISGLYDERYQEAVLEYYRQYNEELARIYIDLVKLRHEIAETLGFDSYAQMQYVFTFERDFEPQQADAYIADIKEYIVPVYKEIMQANPYYNISYDYLPERKLLGAVGHAADKIGGVTKEAFDFMLEYDLYDTSYSMNKASMSFQTYLVNYEAPFLFVDSYGGIEDILTLSHEFGHFLDAYYNYDAYETVDVAECFSQAMEYLMLTYYDGYLTEEEIDELYQIKMLDTLNLYVQQASFAEFENIVYAADTEELNAQFLNDLSLQIAIDYGYYDGVSEQYYAMCWSDITHFFEYPFYIISYPVSNDIAMQIHELEQQSEGSGIERYMEMLPREYIGLIDTVTAAGLESPFAPGRIEKVAADLYTRLSDIQAAA